MRVKLATVVTALICVSGFGAFTIMSPAATAAKPDLCETECGGKWGAREHAAEFARQHGLKEVTVYGCELNSQYGSQWDCWGRGTREERGLGYLYEWHVWMGEYGVEKHWTERVLN
jgi:hypothetical protein